MLTWRKHKRKACFHSVHYSCPNHGKWILRVNNTCGMFHALATSPCFKSLKHFIHRCHGANIYSKTHYVIWFNIKCSLLKCCLLNPPVLLLCWCEKSLQDMYHGVITVSPLSRGAFSATPVLIFLPMHSSIPERFPQTYLVMNPISVAMISLVGFRKRYRRAVTDVCQTWGPQI